MLFCCELFIIVDPMKIQWNLIEHTATSVGSRKKLMFQELSVSPSSGLWCDWIPRAFPQFLSATTWRGCLPEKILLNLVATKASNYISYEDYCYQRSAKFQSCSHDIVTHSRSCQLWDSGIWVWARRNSGNDTNINFTNVFVVCLIICL
jgi:hypothetical protein